MFIAVDGIDGAGKTTLVGQLAEVLKPLDPVVTKEPTNNSHWGQSLRRTALHGRHSKEKEIEYFHNDRMKHLKEVIRPALEAGRPVITDRYVDSTLAYQADSPDEANELYQQFLPDILVPNITFILCCAVEVGLARINRDRQRVTHFETVETLEKARLIFESRRGENYKLLDATGTPEHTLLQALSALDTAFPNLHDLIRPFVRNCDNKAFAC
jgi:dTMP kinase